MRTVVIALVAGAAVARASPPAETLLQVIRDGAPAPRAEAVKRLAGRVRAGNVDAIAEARFAVITDDVTVRAPIIAALISASILDVPTAARVPTAAVLAKQVRGLLPRDPASTLPEPRACRVTGGTARGATIACVVDQCYESCMHVHRELTITTGLRWRIDENNLTRADDGSCGDCMM